MIFGDAYGAGTGAASSGTMRHSSPWLSIHSQGASKAGLTVTGKTCSRPVAISKTLSSGLFVGKTHRTQVAAVGEMSIQSSAGSPSGNQLETVTPERASSTSTRFTLES